MLSVRLGLSRFVLLVGAFLLSPILAAPAHAQTSPGSPPAWGSLVQRADSILNLTSPGDLPVLFDHRMEKILALTDSLPREALDDAFRIHLEIMAMSDARNRHPLIYESLAGLSLRYLRLNEYETLDSLLSVYLPRHREAMDERQLGEFLSLAGYFANRAARHRRSVALLGEALPLAQDRLDSANISTNLASSLQMLGELDLAMERYVETLELYLAVGDSARAVQVMQNMSGIYLNIDRPDRSLALSKEMETYARRTDNLNMRINALTNIATAYGRMDSVGGAIASYEEGLRLAETVGDPLLTARLLLNMGNLYMNQSLYDQALSAFERSMAISEQAGLSIGVLYNLGNLAELELDQGRIESALEYNERAIELAANQDQIELLGRALMQASQIYERLGRFEDALNVLRRASEIKDELYNEQVLTRIEELQVQYDTKGREALLQEKEGILQSLESKLNVQGAALRVFIGIAAALLAITLLVYAYFMRRVRQMRRLYDQSIGSLLKTAPQGSAQGENGGEGATATGLFEAIMDGRFESEQIGSFYGRIVQTMEVERTFTDMDLTLAKLSKLLGTNTQYISKAINQGSGLNFNQFVNHYRVHEAKRLMLGLSDLAAGRVTDSERIMELTGFKSRSTYFNAFKALTGMPPGQFISFSRER